MRITKGHKRISEQNGDEKSDWHYIIQWQSNTLSLFGRIRQNKMDLVIWNKDKAYTQFNKGRLKNIVKKDFGKNPIIGEDLMKIKI